MNIIKPTYEVLFMDLDDPNIDNDICKRIEKAGRYCYVSESKENSAQNFVSKLIKHHHDAMLEHAHMTVLFTVDRGITHEMVRHRLASFAQESTRYCNYSQDKFNNEITVIEPVWYNGVSKEFKDKVAKAVSDKVWPVCSGLEKRYAQWYFEVKYAEESYFEMLKEGATPQEARSVLPTSTKAYLVVTANMREWRHILNLRAAGVTGAPHPQMLEVMVPLLNELRASLPTIFGDIEPMEPW